MESMNCFPKAFGQHLVLYITEIKRLRRYYFQTYYFIDSTEAAGASSAVGFKESIGCATANAWTEYFFDYYTQEYSVALSAYYAAQECNNLNGINSFRVVS